LRPVRLFNTHAHIDHIAGNKYIIDKYKIGLEVHKQSLPFLQHAREFAMALSFPYTESVEPIAFLDEGDIINFGKSQLKVLYTPGHADGSLCFYTEKEKFILFTADFPMKSKPAPEIEKQNKDLAEKYKVEGFPTVLILDKDGKALARTGYRKGGPTEYVEHLKQLIKK